MPFTLNYSVNSFAEGNVGTFTGPAGAGLVNNAGTAGRWNFETTTTGSGGVSPDAPKPGETGYLYTEASSQANGAVFTWEDFFPAFNSSNDDVTLNWSYAARGTAIRAIIELQVNQGGAGWVTVATELPRVAGVAGGTQVIPATSGATGQYYDRSTPLNVNNANTRIRFVVTANAEPTTNFWHNDIAFAAMSLVGTSSSIGDPPVITLNGPGSVNLLVGGSYTEQGATASDTEDGNLTSSVVIGGDTVNVNAAGVYTVTYNVTDSDGNAASEVTRTVTVQSDLIVLNQSVANTAGTFSQATTNFNWTGGGLVGLEALSPGECLRPSGPNGAYQQELSDMTYVLDGNSLVVQGDCYITPYLEKVVTSIAGDAGLVIQNGGTLNVVGYSEFNGSRTYTQRTWYRSQSLQTFNDIGLWIQNGGTLNWVGGEAIVPKGIQFDANSNINLENVVIDNYDVKKDGALSSSEQQIRMASNNFFANGLTLYRGFFTLIAAPQRLDSYRPRQCTQALAFSSATPDINIALGKFDTDGSNIKDIAMWQGCQPVMINAVQGPFANVGPNATGGLNVRGLVRFIKSINHVVVDQLDNALENAFAVKLTDFNSGRRRTYNNERFSTSPYVTEQDFSYAGKTGASGSTPMEVVSSVVSVPTSQQSNALNINTGVYEPDYRFDAADTFNSINPFAEPKTPVMGFTYWALGKIAGSGVSSMLGDEASTGGTKLFDDTNYTAANRAEIQALNALTNSEDTYNYCHLWLEQQLDIINSNIDRVTLDDAGYDRVPVLTGSAIATRTLLNSIGTVGTLLFTRSGQELSTQFNVDLVSGTNAAPLQFDGTTITKYIGTGFTGTINTAGTVTDSGTPRTINYGVTGGQLIINDASAPWTVNGNVVIDNVINNDALNNLVINVTGGASVSTSEPGTGNGLVSIVNTKTTNFQIVFNGALPVDYEYRIYEKSLVPGFIGTVDLAGNENQVSLGIGFNYQFAGIQPAVLQIIADGYIERLFEFDLIDQNQNFTVNVAADTNL